ncbi:MAG: protein kinase [Planctomycetaceae bacterium]
MSDIDTLFEQAIQLHGLQREDFLSQLTEDQRKRIQQLLRAEESLQREGNDFLTPVVPERYGTEPTFLSDHDGHHHVEATFVSRPGTSKDDAQVGDSVRYFGEYELLSEIARGGMGVVFKARQVSLNRIVALKMILSGNLAGSEEISRFQTEAEAAAKLDHWGIVPIYEIGEHDGQHYFSMGLVEGDSLQDLIRSGPLEARPAAELCRKIAEAIAYAHDNGVIHRDLKPANVLLDMQGQPKITDFGLAKQVQNDSNLTRTGAVMGTPGYMPPEQAQGDSDNIGPLADVYSIGAILYACLTGHPPFQAANVMDTLRQVMEQEPVPPRQLNPSIDRDLQTICLKCLEKSAGKRYGSARELKEELQRYLNGEPIVARPVSRVERTWRWCKRKPALASLAAIVALLFLSTPFMAARQAQIASEQARLKEQAVAARDDAEVRRKEAELARTQAEAAKTEAEAAREAVEREQANTAGVLYSTRIALAHREWLDNNPERTRQLLMSCPDDQRDWEWDYLDGLTRSEERLLSAHAIPASVQFSPDGRQLVTRGTSDNELRLWDLETGLETKTKQVNQLVDVDFASDHQHVLVLSADTAAYVHIESGEVRPFGNSGTRVSDGRLFDNDRKLAVVFVDGTVVTYDVASGEELSRGAAKIRSASGHEFSPDATQIVGADHTTVHVYNAQTGEIDLKVTGHAMTVSDAKFSPDGRLLAVADGTGAVSLTELESGRRLQTFRVHRSGATAVQFSRDSKFLASGSQDHTVRLFDVETGEQVLIVRGHSQSITDIDFHPDGTKLATSSADGSVRVWEIAHRMAKAPHVADVLAEERAIHLGHEAGMESQIFYGHKGPLYDVAISPDGRFVATTAMGNSHGDQQICVWSKANADVYASFPTAPGYLHTVSFSKDSRLLIVASGGAGDAVTQGSVTVWDLTTKTRAKEIDGIACMLSAATLNSNNDRLAVVFGNLNYGRLRLYSFPECELLHDQEITGERFSDVAFSPDGKHVITSTQPGGTIAVWSVETLKQQRSWKANGKGVFRIAVGVDDLLATSNIDGVIGIWNWREQKLMGELKGHGVYCVDLDFNPDGTRLVSSSEDDTVKVWNLKTMRELLTFRDHRLSAMGADWSDDGRTIASVSRDGSLILRELNGGPVVLAEDEWLTYFEDDFQRAEPGPSWLDDTLQRLNGSTDSNSPDPNSPDSADSPQWRIENGRLTGILRPLPTGGTTFPAAYIALKGMPMPKQVDIAVDVIPMQPLLVQVVLTNSRTQQMINPFVSTIDQPFGFQGSSVLTSRGTGEMKLLGTRQKFAMQPGTAYRFRVLRNNEDLKFWVNDQLLEHVNVTTIEADVLSLGGSWSDVGDEIAFDNLVVKIPKSAESELRIRKQVNDWLTELLIPELVEEEIAQQFTNAAEQRSAKTFLDGLTAANAGAREDVLEAITKVATRTDATEREYDIAARQADYYINRVQGEWWQWSKVGLAFLRAGRLDGALQRFDLAVEKCLEIDGHVLPLVSAGRALTLHALGKQAEAEAEHRRLLDLCHTGWQSDGLTQLRAELEAKVPVAIDPLQEQLVQKLISSDKAYWYGRNMQKWAADKAEDLVGVQGRKPEPDQYDRTFNRTEYMKLNAIFSTFNPPPAIHLIWDQITFDHEPDSDKARIQWVSIQKFEDMKFRFGQWFDFEQRDGEWLVVKERVWHMDMWVNGEWTVFDDAHWAKLDALIAEQTIANDPALPATLLQASRFEEAYEAAKAAPANASNLVTLGEAAINTKRFDEGLKALEEARRLDPAIQMPWFLTRQIRTFFGHKSIVFGLDFHPTEELMATGHQSKAIVVWNPNINDKILRTFGNAHGAHVTDLAFSHDGSRLVSIGWDNAINVTDAETGKRLKQFSGHLERLYRLERHPSKEIYITSSADNTAKVWDIESGRELYTLVGHDNDVMSATFSPNGNQIATASVDGSIRLWDAASAAELAKLDGHKGGAWRVDFTRDGKSLVSCGRDNMVRIWDIETAEATAELSGHANWIEVVRVSPDGKLAASGDVDGRIFVWDLHTPGAVAVLNGHNNAIYNLRFHDGSLYTVSADRTIRQWNINFETSPLQQSLERVR